MKKIGRTIRRRRREYKTDYRARLALLKSETPRIVVRRTNRYLIVQLVESEIAQDKIISGASSKDLLGHGWAKEKAGSLKSLSAAYLTGLLLAKKAKNVENVVLDIGLNRSIKQGRLYAVVRGLIDGGVKLSCDESCLPSEEKLKENEKTSDLLNKVKEKIQNG